MKITLLYRPTYGLLDEKHILQNLTFLKKVLCLQKKEVMFATFLTKLIAGTIIFAILAPIVGKILIITYAFIYAMITGFKEAVSVMYRAYIRRRRSKHAYR